MVNFKKIGEDFLESFIDIGKSTFVPQNQKFLEGKLFLGCGTRNGSIVASKVLNQMVAVPESLYAQTALYGLSPEQGLPLCAILVLDSASRVVLGQGAIATAREMYQEAKSAYTKYIFQKEADKKLREAEWVEADKKEKEALTELKRVLEVDRKARLEEKLAKLLPQVQAELEEEKLNRELSYWFGSLTEGELNKVVKELPPTFNYIALAEVLADRVDYEITSKPIRREGEVQHHYKIAGSFNFVKSRVDARSNLIAGKNNHTYGETNFLLRSLADEVYKRLEPQFLDFERAGDYA